VYVAPGEVLARIYGVVPPVKIILAYKVHVDEPGLWITITLFICNIILLGAENTVGP